MFLFILIMTLETVLVAGSLPASWASSTAFPSLTKLSLGGNNLSGSLPPDWGSATGLQKLQQLSIFDTQISGEQSHCISTWRGIRAMFSAKLM